MRGEAPVSRIANPRGDPRHGDHSSIRDPGERQRDRAIKRFAEGLPDGYFEFHNLEVATGRGLPYEYDVAVLSPHALDDVEVKGYHGEIRGNPLQWVFENGGSASA